jgi:hypothetical protein
MPVCNQQKIRKKLPQGCFLTWYDTLKIVLEFLRIHICSFIHFIFGQIEIPFYFFVEIGE